MFAVWNGGEAVRSPDCPGTCPIFVRGKVSLRGLIMSVASGYGFTDESSDRASGYQFGSLNGQ